jgi:hypothetical protein
MRLKGVVQVVLAFFLIISHMCKKLVLLLIMQLRIQFFFIQSRKKMMIRFIKKNDVSDLYYTLDISIFQLN